jgi:hypothetical protein
MAFWQRGASIEEVEFKSFLLVGVERECVGNPRTECDLKSTTLIRVGERMTFEVLQNDFKSGLIESFCRFPSISLFSGR